MTVVALAERDGLRIGEGHRDRLPRAVARVSVHASCGNRTGRRDFKRRAAFISDRAIHIGALSTKRALDRPGTVFTGEIDAATTVRQPDGPASIGAVHQSLDAAFGDGDGVLFATTGT